MEKANIVKTRKLLFNVVVVGIMAFLLNLAFKVVPMKPAIGALILLLGVLPWIILLVIKEQDTYDRESAEAKFWVHVFYGGFSLIAIGLAILKFVGRI